MSKSTYYGKRTAAAVYDWFQAWAEIDTMADECFYEDVCLNAEADELARLFDAARITAVELRNYDEFVKLSDIRAFIEEDAEVQAALDEAWSYTDPETPFVQGVDY